MSIDRSLARIVEVESVLPIEGADKIQVAKIKDSFWECVVRKGEFKAGDKAVYFEIDSLLPETKPFDFLTFKNGKHRLKTRRMRGQISQGLLLPAAEFTQQNLSGLAVGTDVTEVLRVEKYEPPSDERVQQPQPQRKLTLWQRILKYFGLYRTAKQKRGFPDFFPKTDQPRLQNCPRYLSQYAEEDFCVEVKLDGSSMTVYHNNGKVGVCSRRMGKPDVEGCHWWRSARNQDIPFKLMRLGRNLAIQGELCGPGIQKNRSKLSELTFFVFDIYDINTRSYLSPAQREEVLDSLDFLGEGTIEDVPVVYKSVKLFEQYATFEDLQGLADGTQVMNKCKREGVVCKLLSNPNVTFKIISNKYLLKHDE